MAESTRWNDSEGGFLPTNRLALARQLQQRQQLLAIVNLGFAINALYIGFHRGLGNVQGLRDIPVGGFTRDLAEDEFFLFG